MPAHVSDVPQFLGKIHVATWDKHPLAMQDSVQLVLSLDSRMQRLMNLILLCQVSTQAST